jgi:hypothetical protein
MGIGTFFLIDLYSQRLAVASFVSGWSVEQILMWLQQFGAIRAYQPTEADYPLYHFRSFVGLTCPFYFDDQLSLLSLLLVGSTVERKSCIISITLASGCVMNFTEVKSKRHIPIYLERGSLVVMQGEARHDWKHGILPRKSDQVDGKIISRGRRISLTFRNIVLPEE